MTVHRILNKDKYPTSFVRVDIRSVKIIDEFLKKRFVYVNNNCLAVSEYLAPAKVLVCNRCFQIGHFRSNCRSALEHCKTCGEGVKDIMLHKESCDKNQCCVRCKGSHESNDLRCPEILSFRAQLTRPLLHANNRTQPTQPNACILTVNDRDFPALNPQTNGNANGKNFNYTRDTQDSYSKRIDEIEIRAKQLDQCMKRLIELNAKTSDQANHIQRVIMKHDMDLKIQGIDVTFQKEFFSQLVSPLCQAIVEIIPALVQQNTLKDSTLLCPSLTGMCAKLANDLPVWTNKFAQNELTRSQVAKDYGKMVQRETDAPTNEDENPPLAN